MRPSALEATRTMVRAIRLLPMMSVDRWALRVSAMPMPRRCSRP